MNEKYAYSYDGENYRGAFASREQAYQQAMQYLGGQVTLPQSIYVGRMAAADPQAAGHAKRILADMASRHRATNGADYLTHVTAHQAAELDCTIELAILGWLQKHELAGTAYKIEAISEHPVPPVPQVRPGAASDEVKELGVGEYPA